MLAYRGFLNSSNIAVERAFFPPATEGFTRLTSHGKRGILASQTDSRANQFPDAILETLPSGELDLGGRKAHPQRPRWTGSHTYTKWSPV